ncbi:MAG: PH domain-containing protein [Gammaproteobacteria bacterium]|nr:PH domain-containing protein [Gammaproteobacteria bacterium]
MNEHEFESSPGLPAPLPAGERVLWQGSPGWWPFACSAFHARGLMVYFAVLVVAQSVGVMQDGGSLPVLAGTAVWMLTLASLALGIALGAGALYARTTIYTVTDRRVVLRFGVAVPLAVNLPFSAIVAADVRRRVDGSADIALTLEGSQRVGVIHMWPCVQTWRLHAPRPLIRGVPAQVAEVLAGALVASAGGTQAAPAARSVGAALPTTAVAA